MSRINFIRQLAEGVYDFKIIKSEYKEAFNKWSLTLETENGERAFHNYDFSRENDLFYAMCFTRKVLKDESIDSVDPEEVIGKFVRAEVVHSIGNNGKTYVNLKSFDVSDGFGVEETTEIERVKPIDLDDILG